MSLERRNELLAELCTLLEIPDVNGIVQAGRLNVNEFEVAVDFFEQDPDAIYLDFEYGIVSGGRTLRIYRLMLEANLTVYAQDQAQLGVNPSTGGIILVVRVPLGHDVNGGYLCELLDHYVEHGRYWQDNILQSSDDMFDQIASGEYQWIRA
ncbi:CesT family type III secretion system chaperone [Pandoraea anhela]|uniref:Molecular chaperone Tir n=1 Tax=Pandoraea anhela TaxID=2508295 RepID=A0A5E4RSC0_9BURK|nr:CesT family type III secretion system chaperone [Pandoraea anhela]VVD66330.1 molecular chaperone Tir [Pandoraea anhela]